MKRTLTILAILLAGYTNGQNNVVVRDLESWLELGARKELFDDKVAIDLQQEFRFQNNSTDLQQYFTEISFEYRLPKEIEIGGGYRFKKDITTSGDFKSVYRIFADLSYKYEFDRLELGTRVRWQREEDFEKYRSKLETPEFTYRLNFEVEYNIPDWKWDPYFAIEGFFVDQESRVEYVPDIIETTSNRGIEKVRFTIGSSNDVGPGDMDLFYRVERELDSYPTVYEPATYFIFGIQYRFKL